MRSWDAALGAHGLVPAQALLVPHDFVDRRQYLHARRTLTRLLELGAVPIVNENDAIASDETRYGDNDRIAALVSHNIGAAVLVLLTDLDGLYTADPHRRRGHARRAGGGRRPAARDQGQAGGSGRGKRRDGEQARGRPHRLVVGRAHGDRQSSPGPGVLAGAIADDAVGTSFEAHRRKLSARKLWIAFASRVAGTVTVDDGARRALVERQTSLLPAGVVDVAGRFGEGDTVDVSGPTASRSPAGWCSSKRPAAQGRRPPHQ